MTTPAAETYIPPAPAAPAVLCGLELPRVKPPSPEGPPPYPAGPLTGQLLDGKYQVGNLLGTGGMSAVYQARHLHLARPCALKVLLAGRAALPEAAARFEREAALASRISHPNVCQVYDFGWTPDGLPWLAMEYLEGQSLATLVAAGPLPAEQVAAIAIGCASGLAAAHDAGIVHRDLKPANVMLVSRAGTLVPVILDFGIAWTPEGQGLTRDGMMVGTPEVMSPEQIAGDPVDHRSDQYQLALLACRLLTGRLPFEADTTQETMVMRLTEPPARLDTLFPGLGSHPRLQAVLDRGLARRPADRFPSIAALGAAINESLRPGEAAETEVLARPDGARVSGEAPGTGDGVVGSRAQRRWLAGKVLIAVVLLLAIVRPWSPGSEPTPPAQPDSSTPTPPAAAVPTPPAAPAPATVPPSSPGASPMLPTEEAVFSPDSAIRRGARQQAEMVYRSGMVPDTIRALAAYMVAEVFRREGLYSTARLWLEQCLALGERKLCRDLRDALP